MEAIGGYYVTSDERKKNLCIVFSNETLTYLIAWNHLIVRLEQKGHHLLVLLGALAVYADEEIDFLFFEMAKTNTNTINLRL